MEMARTIKYSNEEANFPSAMWAKLIGAYILNQTGKSSVVGVSPFEVWMGEKPRIKHLRIIASMSYAYIPDQWQKKMDRKAVKGYLFIYDKEEEFGLQRCNLPRETWEV